MPAPVRAWGPVGHRVAARIAQVRLKPSTLAAIRNLFGKDINLETLSTWADEQQEIPGSSKWHYVDVPIKETRYNPKYCPASGCVVSKIEEFTKVLRDPRADRKQKQIAFKFLIHFIADVHQPMHVGDNNDEGGNLLQVRFYDTGTNLHRVWDSQIIERHTNNVGVWIWDLDFVAKPIKVAEWSRGTPEDWATESLLIAKEAYCVPGTNKVMRPGIRLDDPYFLFAYPIIQQQLARAGVRIAYTLNEIF